MLYPPFNPLFIWTYTQTLRQKTNPSTNYKNPIRTKNCFPHLTTSVKLMSQNKNSRKKPHKNLGITPIISDTKKLFHFSVCNYVCQLISYLTAYNIATQPISFKVQLSSPQLQQTPSIKTLEGKEELLAFSPHPHNRCIYSYYYFP